MTFHHPTTTMPWCFCCIVIFIIVLTIIHPSYAYITPTTKLQHLHVAPTITRNNFINNNNIKRRHSIVSFPRKVLLFQSTTNNNNNHNNHAENNEFDYLLREVSSSSGYQTSTVSSTSRRRIALLRQTDDTFPQTILVASSTTFPMPTTTTNRVVPDKKEIDVSISSSSVDNSEMFVEEENDNNNEEEVDSFIDNDDPYSTSIYGEQITKIQKIQSIQQKQQQQNIINRFENKLKTMDVQDLIVTLFIPGILSFVTFRYMFNKVSTKVYEKRDTIIESFTNEMIQYDGNNKKLEVCVNEYRNKLLWLGPTRNDIMLKHFLENYSKKKTISPQTITTISYILYTIFQLTEKQIATILISLCQEMGTTKISSISKLLFIGTRIMKTNIGKEALVPIKELIMSTYRDEITVAETLVETSQQAIAEAAYRTVVLANGKNQQSLTPGWDILGLKQEDAIRIYNEEKKEGFVSDRESMYGGQTRKYDKKGRQIDTKTGKLINPEDEADDDNENDNDNVGPSTGGAYECGNCGFTLFVAAGRETKFFGPNFKCPECGAPKTDFKPRSSDE